VGVSQASYLEDQYLVEFSLKKAKTLIPLLTYNQDLRQ